MSNVIRFFLGIAFAAAVAYPLPSNAQFVPPEFEQFFDDVTPPALPPEWSALSLQGGQSVTTTASLSHSTPNSVLIPAPNIVSDTSLVSPAYVIESNSSAHPIGLEFHHRRGMETGWDGGVLEIKIGNGEFIDVTDPSVGGTFSQGGYTHTLIAGSSNPLTGRQGWSGLTGGFENVRLDNINVPSGVPFQFRFRLGTDASIGSLGWLIDSVEISVEVDLGVVITPAASSVNAGNAIPFLVQVANSTSITVPSAALYIASAAGDEIESVTLSNGFVQSFSSWFKIVQSIQPIPPFGSAEFVVMVRSSDPPHGGARLRVETTDQVGAEGAEFGLGFLSSTPSLDPGAFTNKRFYFYGGDACTPFPNPPPADLPGAVVFVLGMGPCTFGQAGLHVQEAGGIAMIRGVLFQDPLPDTVANPFIEEPATPGLTIPVLTVNMASFSFMVGTMGSPTVGRISIEGKNSPLRRTAALAVHMLSPPDMVRGDSFRTSLVEVSVDADGDGVPDDIDQCPADVTKSVFGACGCGVPDTDANANGVADCLRNADFRAELEILRGTVRQLSLRKFKEQKSLRNRIKAMVNSISAASASGGITVNSANVDLVKLSKALKKPSRLLVRSANGFTNNKKATLKAINKILKGVSP